MSIWRFVSNLSDAMDQAGAPGPLAPLAPRIRRQYLRLRLAARRSRPGPVTIPILGSPMRADRASNLLLLFTEIFVRKEYAFDPGRPDPVIIDAGANVGMATLFFKTAWPAARVKCVEASPAAFDHLSANARANTWPDVELLHAALASAPGTVRFHLDPDNPASPTASVIPARGGSRSVEVPAVTLSSLVPERVDLLKLDIEGAESDVIDELARSGALPRVRRIILEFHHHLAPGDDERLPRLLDTLARAGMRFTLRAPSRPPAGHDAFQDILIHACRD